MFQCLSDKLANSERTNEVPVQPVLEVPKSMGCQQLFTPERKNHRGTPVPADVIISPHEQWQRNYTYSELEEQVPEF